MFRHLAALSLGLASLLALPARADDGGLPDSGEPLPELGGLNSDAGVAAPAPALPTRILVAVLNLEANKAAADQVAAVTSMLAGNLAESPQLHLITAADIATAMGLERQKQLFAKDGACTESSCLAELSGAVGARFVVTGRLDAFGKKYVLSAGLFDATKAVSLAKPQWEAASEENLPSAARAVAQHLQAALGVPPTGPPVGAGATESDGLAGVNLSLKFGNTFVASISSLGLGGDLDLAYEITPTWSGFLQIGVTFVRATSDGESGRINVVPTVLGIRHLYRVDKDLQPYWGVGLGVQLSFGQFGFFSDSGPLPNVYAIAGMQYLFWKHFGVLLDLSTNIAQAILGLTQNGLGSGLNLDVNIGVVFRF